MSGPAFCSRPSLFLLLNEWEGQSLLPAQRVMQTDPGPTSGVWTEEADYVFKAGSAVYTCILCPISFLLFMYPFLFPFYFLNYKSTITHLQEPWKIQNKVTYSSTIYYNYFLSRLIKIFSCSFNIKLSKINRMNIQKSKKIQ